jgi:SsrA-binding protein
MSPAAVATSWTRDARFAFIRPPKTGKRSKFCSCNSIASPMDIFIYDRYELSMLSAASYNRVMAKKKRQPSGIVNRRARHDYELSDELVVGLSLTGAETKALRMGHGHLRGAYVNIKDDELWLFNATITGTNSVKLDEQEQTRSRKILAKRKEIDSLIQAKQQGMTIIPLSILTKGRYIKLKIAVARGKRKYDKRQLLKARDQKRDMDAAIRQRL